MSTFAPTALGGTRVVRRGPDSRASIGAVVGDELYGRLGGPALLAEEVGVDALLVPQRWWGSGQEVEASTFDAYAMTAWYAARTERIGLVTALHPGFVLPSVAAKWATTVDRLSGGRWAVNVTTGWHLDEFARYGVEAPDHDRRYARSAEFIDVLAGAWHHAEFSFHGEWFTVERLRVEPRPVSARLTVYAGGMSPAALDLAAHRADFLYVNGMPPERLAPLVADLRARAAAAGRTVGVIVYAIPLRRDSDAAAEADLRAMLDRVDPHLAARRRQATSGAQGMWSSTDPVSVLDTNEGFASRLVGTAATIERRAAELLDAGASGFQLLLTDERTARDVVPRLKGLGPGA